MAQAHDAGTTARVARIVVAVNPHASFGRRAGVGERVTARLRAAGHDVVELRESSLARLRAAAARALRDRQAHTLVVVGGDGMVSLGVNVLAGTEAALGLVPTGTGNDTARSLGIPIDDPDAAVELLLARLRLPPRRIDLGAVTCGDITAYFAGALSAGLDALVNERANAMSRPKGASRYTLALVRVLLTFHPVRYRLVVDGDARTTEAMLVCVANGRSIGGGMLIAPDALLDDGALDLVIVDRMPKVRLLRLFPLVFRGEHTERPEVHLRRVRTVSLDASGMVAYADGERIGPLPVQVAVAPGALRVHA
jgi:diacylglycerol kinase (ATP)